MELPKISLDSVKSKLGISQPEDAGYGRRSSRNDDYADDYAQDYADDYGDYGDYDDYSQPYADDYADDGYEAPGSKYEPYNQVTTRETSASRRSSAGVSAPRLVSMTDVRASTHLPSEPTVRPASYRSSSTSSYKSSSSSSFRTLIDNTTPAPSSPADQAPRGKERSESLNGLFGEPTVGAAPAPAVSAHSGLGSSPLSTQSNNFDFSQSYAGGATTTVHTPSRSLEIFKPMVYEDVEKVARTLRAGNVAILALTSTPADLSKRVLDFAFGVASALEATVDCVAPKVFVITTGAALSDAERMRLRSQGIL